VCNATARGKNNIKQAPFSLVRYDEKIGVFQIAYAYGYL
jgi:hypothetical protein